MSKSFEKNWEIVKALTATNFKLRYQGSMLGYVWSLLKPLLLFSVLYTVFSVLMKNSIPNYQVYLLLGIVIFNFFAEATSIGLSSLLEKKNLISKIYFPRILIVIASTFSSLITFSLNLIILVVFLVISNTPFSTSMLFFPVYIIDLYMLSLGVALLLSCLYIRLRDLSHIWEIILQMLFWLTPIFYTIEIVPLQFHRLFYFNPITRIIDYSRTIFLAEHIPSFRLNAIIFCVCLAVLLIGLFVFKKSDQNLVENL